MTYKNASKTGAIALVQVKAGNAYGGLLNEIINSLHLTRKITKKYAARLYNQYGCYHIKQILYPLIQKIARFLKHIN